MGRSIRIAVLLVAALLLLSSGAFAAPRAVSEKSETGFIALVWQLFGSFVPATEKARGSMDPDGQPASSTSSDDDGDARGSMDPDG